MKKNLNKIKEHMIAFKVLIATLFFGFFSNAHAALPDPVDPENAAADGDYIGQWLGYAYDIGIAIGLILATVAFIVVAKNMIQVYNEIGDGKKTWGSMGAHGSAGVLLLVVIVFLLAEAATVIF